MPSPASQVRGVRSLASSRLPYSPAKSHCDNNFDCLPGTDTVAKKRGNSKFRKSELQSAFCRRSHEDLLTGVSNAMMDARAGRMRM